MKTKLKTAHEEEYSYGEVKKIFGVLLNYSDEDETWKDSFVYVFNPKTTRYTFFHTIVDLINSQLYGDEKIIRAYMDEEEFDEYYDKPIEGGFKEKLVWV